MVARDSRYARTISWPRRVLLSSNGVSSVGCFGEGVGFVGGSQVSRPYSFHHRCLVRW